MPLHPLRLYPDQNLRAALRDFLRRERIDAAFVVAGIGSLTRAAIRLANGVETSILQGPLEILTLCGSLSPDDAHLHISVSDEVGRVTGGHVGWGCIIRTTAEILLSPLEDYAFSRETDQETGHRELIIRHK